MLGISMPHPAGIRGVISMTRHSDQDTAAAHLGWLADLFAAVGGAVR